MDWWLLEDEALTGGMEMVAMETRVIGIFVDKNCPERWIVQDAEGNFWIVPPVENPWDNREPFYPTEDTELEPVPGHYKYVLGLPD
jgi:hypothetical protein